MAEQQQSIKVILDKILRHPLLQEISLETVVDYSVDFMRIVGVPSIFEEKTALIQIKKYRCALQCDYYQMIQVRNIRIDGKTNAVFRYSSDTFHMSDLRPEMTDYTYKIQGGIIYTSLEEGPIEISYQALGLDSEGYPLIPDNSSFTRALEAYIKKQQFTILFDLGKISNQVLHQALQDYSWAVGDCENEFHRMSLDKAESFYNMWRTMIIKPSEHKQRFVHSGTQERLKNK